MRERRTYIMEGKRLKALKVFSLAAAVTAVTAIAEASGAEVAGAVPDFTAGWKHLWKELMIDITVIGVLFALVTIYLLIANRRRSPDEVGKGKKLTPLAAFGWVFIPAFIFMADDIFLAAKNFELWQVYRTVPKGAYEIEVEGYMWGFDVKYPDGITSYNEMRVPAGTPVKVNLKSRDVVHSFFIPDFKVKWDMVPGMDTYLWFYPKETGEHVMTCAEYCGMLHSSMFGKVIVLPPDEFNKWVSENKAKGGKI